MTLNDRDKVRSAFKINIYNLILEMEYIEGEMVDVRDNNDGIRVERKFIKEKTVYVCEGGVYENLKCSWDEIRKRRIAIQVTPEQLEKIKDIINI